MRHEAVYTEDTPSAPPKTRFESLDSMRGLCAVMIVLYHFNVGGYICSSKIVRNGFAVVDFFFVLSGFVISYAFAQRIASGKTSLGQFMMLRAGRIYPLHIAVLAAYLALEIVKLTTGFGGARPPFEGSMSLSSLVLNVLLLQSFGLLDHLSWNGPAWSIAAEMWTYLLFAALLTVFPRKAVAILGVLGAASFAALYLFAEHGLDSTYDWGFVRCVFGFSLGSLAYWLHQRGLRIGGTVNETVMILATLALLYWLPDNRNALIAPVIFLIVVLVFASGRGAVSRLLNIRPLILLGTLSYSIYMVHLFVLARFTFVLKFIGGPIGVQVQPGGPEEAGGISNIVAPGIVLDLLTVAVVAVVLLTSAITYSLIERPGIKWSKSLVGRRAAMAVQP